jgi:S1-C subfamily serine protease
MRVTLIVAAPLVAILVGDVLGQARAETPASPNAPQSDILLLRGPGTDIGLTVADAGSGNEKRVIVNRVARTSAAASGGLRTGDVVMVFDGEPVTSAKQLTRLVQETPPGRVVK